MKILVNGATGVMGGYVLKAIEKGYGDSTLAAAVNVRDGSLLAFNGDCDCIIDFSHHLSTPVLVDVATRKNIPLVIATTGQSEEEMEIIKKASEIIPVFYSGNMAISITVFGELIKTALKAYPEAEVEIVECHHTRKHDAPSGTALMLGKAALEARPNYHLTVGRTVESGKRDSKEITIHSLRMGNVVGDHEIIINAGNQIFTMKHQMLDRAVFAEGAIVAANYLVKQKPGFYGMKDLIKSL